jgi:hypothetical protein
MATHASRNRNPEIPILRPTPLTWGYVAFAVLVLLSLLTFL